MLRRSISGTALIVLAELFFAWSAWSATETRTSAFEYNSAGLLIREIIEPNDSDLCLVTTYGYDNFGNRSSVTTRNCNGTSSGGVSEAPAPTGTAVFTTRTSTSDYITFSTPPGRFPTAIANALSHVEQRAFHDNFGTVTSLTGPNNLVTSWTFDNFGRKYTETRADGTVTTWTYTTCGTCPTNGRYFVTVTTRNGTTTVVPTTITYYDSLNREIRTETQGFAIDSWARKDTQYDSKGRIAQVSKPYLAGQTIYWTVYGHDDLGRVTQRDEPATAPGTLRTATAYNGLVTTATVSNAGTGTGMPNGVVQTKTTSKNSQGQVVEVKDTQNNPITYSYDPFGNLLQTYTGATTSFSYDRRGRKIQMIDPDMGSWTYRYNALGELKWQCDPVSRAIQSTGNPPDCTDTVATRLDYDKLGRMITRTERDLVSNWYHDAYQGGGACNKGKGKLCQVTTDNNYNRTITYDSLGRLSVVLTTFESDSYSVTTAYDGAGRVDVVTYPTGFKTKNYYSGYGYLWKVQQADAGGSTVFWQANSLDAAGNVTSELLGNNITTKRCYDELFRPKVITTSTNDCYSAPSTGTVHHLALFYDVPGNVSQRQDLVQSVTENFTYDTLNRLTMASGAGPTRTFDYSTIGNVTYKSDAGTYTYPAVTAPRPHAVSSTSGTISASYGYDANGNLTWQIGTISGVGGIERSLSYASFNKPRIVYESIGFPTWYRYTYTYNADHERMKLITERQGETLTTIYLHSGGGASLFYEKETRQSTGVTEYRHYVQGGAGPVGVYVTKSTYGAGEGPQMRYYHRDHLGSIVRITDPSGGPLETLGYEAFGERRYPNGTPQDRGSPIIGITTDRGFTGHEHLDEMNLIHMNGRIFDPALARFMTPDPFVQSALNLQSYNRYSYANNNPLRTVDPSGFGVFDSDCSFFFCPIDSVLGATADFVGSILDPLSDAGEKFMAAGGPIIVANWFILGPGAGLGVTGNAMVNAAIAGGATGLALGGDSRSILAGAVGGALFNWAGGQGGTFSPTRFWAHALAGCAMGAIGGTGCGQQAFAAVGGHFAGAAVGDMLGEAVGKNVAGFVAAVVAGGTASQLGGGKFGNGAYTAAFSYLFNELGDLVQRGYALQKVNLPGLGDSYLDPRMAKAVQQWVDLAKAQGVDIEFTSGFRQEGQALTGTVYPPAQDSLHKAGLAIDTIYVTLRDVPNGLSADQQRAILRSTANSAGVSWGGSFGDPVHFQIDPYRNAAHPGRRVLIDNAQKAYCRITGPC